MADNAGYAPLGKAGMLPRNKWVIGTIYHKLDIVTHNENTYMALKDNAQEPTDDGENWMLLLEGVPIATTETAGKVKPDGETITADEDGTLHGASQVPEGVTFVDLEAEDETLPTKIPVNADQLGGQNPEYYATEESVSKIIGGETAVRKATDADTVDGYHANDFVRGYGIISSASTGYTTLLEWLIAVRNSGAVSVSARVSGFSDLPRTDWGYGLFARLEGNIQVEIWQFLAGTNANGMLRREINTKREWSSNWSTCFLPLTGGTLTNSVIIDAGTAFAGFINSRTQSDGTVYQSRMWSGSDKAAVLGLYTEGTILSQLSLYTNKIMAKLSGANYAILHTGNSNPIIQSTSAPTDTTALWYNTTTKTLKSYTDGAWT